VAETGEFTDVDRSAVVNLLDENALKSGIAGRLLRKIDGVVISPAGSKTPGAATITVTGLVTTTPIVFFEPPSDFDRRHIRDRIDASGVDSSGVTEVRDSFGVTVFEFGNDPTGTELVAFAISGLAALGVKPADGRWEYRATEPEGD